MIKVLICEDNEKELNDLKQTITNYILMENLDMEVSLTTACPETVIDFVQNEPGPFLCFLDIELKTDEQGVGVVLASKIRHIHPEALIVFVTSNPQYMPLTFEYKVGAVGFLEKGKHHEQKVTDYIEYANEMLNQKHHETADKFVFKVGDKIVTERYEDIMSFEIASKNMKKVTLYAKNRNHEFLGTLIDIEAMDARFFRCDRSVVVNVENIHWIDPEKKEIHLISGDVCSGSARGIKELRHLLKAKNNR